VAKEISFLSAFTFNQDTTKVIPATPFGRVEEFYDFTKDPTIEPEKKVDTTKTSVKAKKTKEVQKIQEKLVKAEKTNPVEVTVNDISNTNEIAAKEESVADSVILGPIPDFNFLEAASFKGFSFEYIIALDSENFEVDTKEAELISQKFKATSLFNGHELQRVNPVPISKTSENHDGLFVAFLAVLSILSVANTVYYKKFQKYLSAFFNIRINFQVLREERSFNSHLYFLLLISSLFLSSAYIYQFVTYYGWESYVPSFSEQHLFIKILSLVLSLLMIKFLVVKITGAVFQHLRLASDYIFTMIMYFNILTLLLLPISICIQYLTFIPSYFLFYLGLVIASIIQVLFIFRVFQIGNSEPGTSAYYIFLYLCTLEILPLVVLIKLLVNVI
jgi:hypothetical protein